MDNQRSNIDILFNATVVVAALGYFVDIYDLLLFLVVGRTSIAELQGLPTIDDFVTAPLLNIQNMQMIGMLIGGVLWGVLGDKKGRLSVLFGSILLYSVANILNCRH